MDDDQRLRRDDQLDEALRETFPASDPPANTVETGIRIAVDATAASDAGVTDNREAGRFELAKGDQLAFLKYERKPDRLVLVHTEVPSSLRGQHIGDVLVKAALEAARAEGLRVVPQCPFVQAYLRRHPELATSR
jgi:predicted GNAT family acetyltransferase